MNSLTCNSCRRIFNEISIEHVFCCCIKCMVLDIMVRAIEQVLFVNSWPGNRRHLIIHSAHHIRHLIWIGIWRRWFYSAFCSLIKWNFYVRISLIFIVSVVWIYLVYAYQHLIKTTIKRNPPKFLQYDEITFMPRIVRKKSILAPRLPIFNTKCNARAETIFTTNFVFFSMSMK